MTITVEFKDGKIEHSDICDKMNNWEHGGQNYFFGAVREVNLGKQVTAIHYDLFEPLARVTIEKICKEAIELINCDADVVVMHSYNKLAVGDISIGIAVSTKHRDESYIASRYVIEKVKERAPIWKKEFYETGETEWVQGHALCQHNKARHMTDNHNSTCSHHHV